MTRRAARQRIVRPPKLRATPYLRPFRTEYFNTRDWNDFGWSGVGHAASVRGAIRAAFTHLLDAEYVRAAVHDEDGIRVALLERRGSRIHVTGPFR